MASPHSHDAMDAPKREFTHLLRQPHAQKHTETVQQQNISSPRKTGRGVLGGGGRPEGIERRLFFLRFGFPATS